jgi:hypothetical protein
MTTLVVRHTVTNFDARKAGFEARDEGRRPGDGVTGHRVLRDVNDVLAPIELPDAATAAQFQNDPGCAR